MLFPLPLHVFPLPIFLYSALFLYFEFMYLFIWSFIFSVSASFSVPFLSLVYPFDDCLFFLLLIFIVFIYSPATLYSYSEDNSLFPWYSFLSFVLWASCFSCLFFTLLCFPLRYLFSLSIITYDFLYIVRHLFARQYIQGKREKRPLFS